jgi:hypothetical protein
MPVAIRLQQIVREGRSERITKRRSDERKNRRRHGRVSANESSAPGDAMLFHPVMQFAPVVIAFAGRRFEHIVHRGRGANQSTAIRNAQRRERGFD